MIDKGVSMLHYGNVKPRWSMVSLCGLIRMNPGESEPDYHFHDNDEYFLVTEGKGTVHLEGEDKTMEAGDVVCIPKGGKHRISGVSEELHLIFLYCRPKGRKRFGHIPVSGDEPFVEGCKVFKSWEWLEEKPGWSKVACLGILRYGKGIVEMDYHYHDCHEYYFIARGSIAVLVRGRRVMLECGDVYPIRKGTRHKVLEAAEDATLVFVQDRLTGRKRYGHL